MKEANVSEARACGSSSVDGSKKPSLKKMVKVRMEDGIVGCVGVIILDHRRKWGW